jgi:hypothetical protein
MGEPEGPYAPPRRVEDPRDCHFYHSMELPGLGTVPGEWDLRGRVDAYLGGLDPRGKRVLECGTASGFLCFEMERRGAEVIGHDASEERGLDAVPFAGRDHAAIAGEHRAFLRRSKNAWWLAHRLLGSRARVVYSSIYAIPPSLGPVDVATFGCILLHLRDPFEALRNGARLARETVVVTERLSTGSPFLRGLETLGAPPAVVALAARAPLRFLPDPRTGGPDLTWWALGPALVRRWLAILGFAEARTTFHAAPFQGSRRVLYTVVARRTAGRPEP